MIKALKTFLPVIAASLLSAFAAVIIYRQVEQPKEIIIQREQVPPEAFDRKVSYKSSTPSTSKRNTIVDQNFVRASQEATPGVVFINTRQLIQRDFFGGNSYGTSSGSGVIISPNGYIVTNNHVIENGEKISVTLNDNREYDAKIIGTDPTTDIALLKIEEENLPHLLFGNSDSLQVGEWVLAIGSPFRLQSTVTAGIVSAKARNINILENQQYGIESFIQTDAAVNPGNSGGALVNIQGDLIGVNTAIITQTGKYEGYSFAVPSNLVQKIIRDLKDYGSVQRGLLGINISNVDASIAEELDLPNVEGILISNINPGSAAAESGLKMGDVIIRINNSKVASIPELQELIARFRPGDQVEVGYFRNGKYNIKQVTLKNYINTTDLLSTRMMHGGSWDDLGMEARDLTRAEMYRLETKGVRVESITRNSKLHRTNMEAGFIITKVNKNPISNVDELAQAIDEARHEVIFEGFYEQHDGAYWYTFKK